jgi:glutamate--cysteine ligase
LDANEAAALSGGLVGLEKESLRVAPDGTIAQTPHPRALGAALTHPYITTDYSEALLEVITPPMANKGAVLTFLRDAHKFVYENLGDEILWATSMPCVLQDETAIPISRYGKSNAGLMKTVYRRGLGYRYGRTMQVIAGVHFNYSLPEFFWPMFQELEQNREPLDLFVSEYYMGMIRNLQRFGWLIPYLFGASPAVCKSFLGGMDTDLAEFDDNTVYYPFGTSLRMGDIGYQNSLEEGRGFKANYDSLDAYIRSLTWAIETTCPENEAIGVVRDGVYRQLSASVLQIENEHYSTIRPKQITEWMEKPTQALRRRGVRYVELRSVDVNAFDPLGVSEDQLYFLETFLIFCLLHDSPRINATESKTIDRNQILSAHHGREPGLVLQCGDRALPLKERARDLLTRMLPLAEVLDGASPQLSYRRVLQRQLEVVENPELTPSALMLARMREQGEGFFRFAQRMSELHRDWFGTLDLPAERREFFKKEADDSLEAERAIEDADDRPFEQFLEQYFAG